MPARQSSNAKYYKLNGRTAKIAHGPKDNRVEYDEFVGTLVDIHFDEDEYDGRKTFRYRLEFKDEDGNTEFLTVSMGTIAASNILNCLASIDGKIDYLLIRPYIIESLDVAAVYMEHNGEKLEWKHGNDDLPDTPKEKNRFFHKIFEEVKEKLESQKEANVAENLYDEPKEDPQPVTNENLDDQLPF